MNQDYPITIILKDKGLTNIEIDEIFNYLETLDYDLTNTRYIGGLFSSNERLAKYFFLRDKLKIEIPNLDETLYINEILDQCIDWSEFWRLLVVRQGFCCIRLSKELQGRKKFVFCYGPNIISESSLESNHSIYEDRYY